MATDTNVTVHINAWFLILLCAIIFGICGFIAGRYFPNHPSTASVPSSAASVIAGNQAAIERDQAALDRLWNLVNSNNGGSH